LKVVNQNNKYQATQGEIQEQQSAERKSVTGMKPAIKVGLATKRPLLESEAIYSMCLRELIRFFRMKTRTISAIVSPFTWMILFGLPLSRLFPSGTSFEGLPFFAFVVPGIIGMGLLFSGTNSGVTVLWDKEFGFLKEVMVAPVRRTSLMLGRSLGAMVVAMFQGLLTIGIALLFGIWFGFHIASMAGFFLALAFMVVTFLTFVGFGLTLGALIEGTEGFMSLVSMIEMPLFFLSGGMFPLSQVKGIPVLYQVEFMNPLTYGVDGIRGALTGKFLMSPYLDFAVIACSAVLFLLLGTYAFTRMEVG
jgi:ABC-2 type transport system permease protein